MMVMVMRILDEECDEGDDDNDDGRKTDGSSEVTYKPAVQDNTFPNMIIYIFCWP